MIDLDPKGAPFADTVTMAGGLHAPLDEIGVLHDAKTSGGTGLHILVPLGAEYPYDAARTLVGLVV